MKKRFEKVTEKTCVSVANDSAPSGSAKQIASPQNHKGKHLSELPDKVRRKILHRDPDRYLRLLTQEILYEMPGIIKSQAGKALEGSAGCASFLKAMLELGKQKAGAPRSQNTQAKSRTGTDRAIDLIPSANERDPDTPSATGANMVPSKPQVQ